MRLALMFVVAVLSVAAQLTAQQTTQTPSLQETLDYVNSKIDRDIFPDWKVYLSSDHEVIMEGGRGARGTISQDWDYSMEVNAMSLDGKGLPYSCNEPDPHCYWGSGFSVVSVSCASSSKCAKYCRTTRLDAKTCSNASDMDFPGYPLDDESKKRLVKAYTHLVELLQAEYHAKHDKDDPFAK